MVDIIDKKGKYIISWSGGKDSALALYRAKLAGIDISYLLTVFSPDGFTMSHRIPRNLVQEQSRAMGIPFVECVATWDSYEQEFKRVLLMLKEKGAAGCVFGDIDIEDHVTWCRNICAETGLIPFHPLYGDKQEQLVLEFINTGFDAVIVVVNQDKLDKKWLGKKLDLAAVQDFKSLDVSIAGEFGEYHTIVVGGPVFKNDIRKQLEMSNPQTLTRDRYAFWDLSVFE